MAPEPGPVAERRYTLAQATALLGRLTDLIERMRDARDVLAREAESEGTPGDAGGNAGGPAGARLARAALTLEHGLAQLNAWGVIVRDLDEGICDFPADRDGRLVYLCWRLGEEEITAWHEVDAGFRGRQSLDDRFDAG